MQNIALIYDNKNDATTAVVPLLFDAFMNLRCNALLIAIDHVTKTDLTDVDTIIIGSPFSFGTVSSNFTRSMESTNTSWYDTVAKQICCWIHCRAM